MPTRYRGPDGQPREVRVSLRTKEPVRARILVLEFKLALERIKMLIPFESGVIGDQFSVSANTAPSKPK